MIDTILSLASYGFFQGGGLGDLFNYWEQAGVFTYLLPLLIIFCLVFVIMNNLKLFEQNKAVSAIIALSVGLLAMQFDIVPLFFSELFPRVGVGLSIILAGLILVGLFIDTTKTGTKWVLFGISALILAAVLWDSAGYSSGFLFYYALNPQILSWIILAIIIITVVIGVSKKPKPLPDFQPVLFGRGQPEGPLG